MIRLSKRVIVVNIFGTIGYLLLLVALGLLVSELLIHFIVPSTPFTAPTVSQSSLLIVQQAPFSGFFIGLGCILVVISAVIFIALPYLIGRWSAVMMRRLLGVLKLAPIRKNVFLAKGAISVLPVVGFLVLATVLQPSDMLFSTVYMTTVLITVIVLLTFLIQLLCAEYFKVSNKDIW